MSFKAILSTLPEIVMQNSEKALHEIYIAESLRLICENIAKSRCIGGSYISLTYSDLINGRHKEDNRTGEEIIADVIRDMGIELF